MGQDPSNTDKSKGVFPYVHGFSPEEQNRLKEQARFAEHTLFREVNFGKAKHVLEVGCGVGAQTEILLRRFPNLKVTGIDFNDRQLQAAKDYLAQIDHFAGRYQIEKMDATDLDFKENSFDGAYLCWVLEHIPKPQRALAEVKRILKSNSRVYITEVLNTAFFLDPYSPAIWHYWNAFNDFQFAAGGNPFIGAKLGNFMLKLGFKDIKIHTITWHLDNRNPEPRKEYMEYWFDLAFSSSQQLVDAKYLTEAQVDAAKKERDMILKNPDAVIYDCFIQASAKT